MMVPVGRPTGVRLLPFVCLTSVALVAGCSGDATSTGTQSAAASSSMPAESTLVDAQRCAQKPPTGAIDRTGYDLRFTRGRIYISSTPAAPQAATPLPPEGAPPQPATPTTSTSRPTTTCHRFERWGDPVPDVPPDSLLFVFKGGDGDGAQVEFPVNELTGEHLPPIGVSRPTVGPLTEPIAATIGLSADGTFHSSGTCRLRLTAMSAKRAAGHFDCPAATLADTDPLNPDDDVPFDEESSTPPPSAAGPGQIDAAASAVDLAGWFDLQP